MQQFPGTLVKYYPPLYYKNVTCPMVMGTCRNSSPQQSSADNGSPMVRLVNEGAVVKVPFRDSCVFVWVCESVCNPAGEVGEVKGGLMSSTHKPWLTQLGFKDLSSKTKQKKRNGTRASTQKIHFQRQDKENRVSECSTAVSRVFKHFTNHYTLFISSL